MFFVITYDLLIFIVLMYLCHTDGIVCIVMFNVLRLLFLFCPGTTVVNEVLADSAALTNYSARSL